MDNELIPSDAVESERHYFAERPDLKSRQGSVNLVLPGIHLRLATDRGVFSATRIDPGTRILLESVPPPPPAGNLLDLGCGYGPIALTMASRAPSARVLAVDVNERAVALTKQNAETAGLYNVDSMLERDMPQDIRFSAIWSNPPIRIGKRALHDLLLTWLARLTPDGRAHLVVQRHLGSDSLHKWLEGQGYAVTRLAARSGYRVLEVTGMS